MASTTLERELKRGSAELLILALLEERQRHGYEIGRLIDGRWVERTGQRRRRYYKLTRAGRRTLASQRTVWDTFFSALNQVARIKGSPA
jgi:DNA-binding PadR family transcriptional regulator